MSIPADREGQFKAQITEYGIKEFDSGAIAVALKVHLTEIWDGEGWQPWAEFQMEAEGDLWIIKKDGQINKLPTESLIRHAGWDGNIESLANETWQPCPIQVAIKKDVYEGNTRFKINFVNAFDRVPGGLSNVTPDKAKELQTRFGGQLRAIAGNNRRNGAPATGAPATPPRPAFPATPPRPEPVGVGDPSNDSEIPF